MSTTLIYERRARASLPSTIPTDGRSWCSRLDVVSGTTRHVCALYPARITTGRRNSSPVPSCSKPTFTPSAHHQISRTVYKRDSSSFTDFFIRFQLSKFFDIKIELNMPSDCRALLRMQVRLRRRWREVARQFFWSRGVLYLMGKYFHFAKFCRACKMRTINISRASIE